MHSLGSAAADRGLYRDAARLYKQANTHGDPLAGAILVRLLHTLCPGDQRPADWAAAHTRLDNPRGLAGLLDALREAGATGQITALLDRDPAGHTRLDNPYGLAGLLDALREAGATGQITALAARAAAHAPLDKPFGLARLPGALREVGATDQAAALAARAAAHAPLDDPRKVAQLLNDLREAGDTDQITTLLDRNPAAHTCLDEPDQVARLVYALREVGATGQVTALFARAVARARLAAQSQGCSFLDALRDTGVGDEGIALLDHDPATLDPEDVRNLLGTLRVVGFTRHADEATPDITAVHVSLNDPFLLARLLNDLHEGGHRSDRRAAGS